MPAHVLASALYERFSSRGEADYADKLLSALRKQFGGHVEQKPRREAIARGHRAILIVDHRRGNSVESAALTAHAENLAAVRSSYEAFSRGDLDGALAMMDDEIVWHQAEGLAHGGVYHGLAAVTRGRLRPDRRLVVGRTSTRCPPSSSPATTTSSRSGATPRSSKATGQAARRAVRAHLEVRGRQGRALPPVHRHAQLGRRADRGLTPRARPASNNTAAPSVLSA